LKIAFGSIIFLASLFLMRQVLVGTALMNSTVVMLFLVAAVGIPLGGIVLVEGALEHEVEDLRARIDSLEKRLRDLGGDERSS
jgi:hypothetical protein